MIHVHIVALMVIISYLNNILFTLGFKWNQKEYSLSRRLYEWPLSRTSLHSCDTFRSICRVWITAGWLWFSSDCPGKCKRPRTVSSYILTNSILITILSFYITLHFITLRNLICQPTSLNKRSWTVVMVVYNTQNYWVFGLCPCAVFEVNSV
jgi:hypothetical protein